jgi:hypothetical protein
MLEEAPRQALSVVAANPLARDHAMRPEATSMEPNAFYNMNGQSARCLASSASTLWVVVMRELENDSGHQEQQLLLFAPKG